MWFFRGLIKSHYSSKCREIPPSMFPPCAAATALLPAAYSNTSLLNNFKSQRQLWPIHAPPKPSLHPSLCPSSDPISQWNHQELIPISALAQGPKQCRARLNSAVNSQPFLQCPSLLSQLPPPFTQTPSLPILGGFWMRAFMCTGCSYAQFTGHV